jgi:hypothetical protein
VIMFLLSSCGCSPRKSQHLVVDSPALFHIPSGFFSEFSSGFFSEFPSGAVRRFVVWWIVFLQNPQKSGYPLRVSARAGILDSVAFVAVFRLLKPLFPQ